jgi:hypothetical protein
MKAVFDLSVVNKQTISAGTLSFELTYIMSPTLISYAITSLIIPE